MSFHSFYLFVFGLFPKAFFRTQKTLPAGAWDLAPYAILTGGMVLKQFHGRTLIFGMRGLMCASLMSIPRHLWSAGFVFVYRVLVAIVVKTHRLVTSWTRWFQIKLSSSLQALSMFPSVHHPIQPSPAPKPGLQLPPIGECAMPKAERSPTLGGVHFACHLTHGWVKNFIICSQLCLSYLTFL